MRGFHSGPIPINRDPANYQILTRLRIGSETADQQLLAISTNLGREWAENNGFLRFRIEPYQTELTGTLRPALLLVSGAVGLVLLLAIANVSGLLLARASTRRSEIATRVALGGSRGRIIRQLLTESLLLGLLAGVGGVLLGALLLRILPGLTPLQLGLNQSLTLSWPVLAFALLISGSSGLLFGCAPAWQAAGQNTAATSQSGGSRGTTRAGGRFRQALVISEVAMCVILLMVAGLLLRTMVNLRAVEPGFDPRNVLTAQMSMQGSHLESAEGMTAFYQAALERIRSQPGVEGAAVSNNLPVERGMNLPLEINLAEGRGIKSVDWRYVSPDFFQTLGIPLHEGRLFEESDTRSSLPVMIVNRAFRDAYFSGREVEQQRIGVYPFTSEIAEPERVVIGVVENVKGQGLAAPPLPTVYVPVDQVTTELVKLAHQYFQMNWLIKLQDGVPADQSMLRSAVRSVDPLQPFSGFRSMEEIMESSIASRRAQLFLLGAFALLALVMAMTGVYGLMAFQVTQQSRELGIRVAVGATPRDLLLSQLRRGLLLGGLGLGLGCGFSLLLGRLLESFLFGVQALDPWTFLLVGLLVLLVSTLASLAPALKATRVDPVSALAGN